MKECILCGAAVKYPSFDFCEACFAMTIEEIEEKFLKKGASATRQDQLETHGQERSCEPPRPITFLS